MARANIKELLIDDEAQFRATTEKILKRRRFDTVSAVPRRTARRAG